MRLCLFLKNSQVQSTLETLINFSRTLFYNDLLKKRKSSLYIELSKIIIRFFFHSYSSLSRRDTAMKKNRMSTFKCSL